MLENARELQFGHTFLQKVNGDAKQNNNNNNNKSRNKNDASCVVYNHFQRI